MESKINTILKKFIKVFIKYVILFVCLIAFFVLSLSLTSAYPNFLQRHVKYNIEYSADRMAETETDWQFFFTPNNSSKIDNYADSLMLHITYCDDILPPIKAAMAGALYGDTYAKSQVNNLTATTKGEPAGDLVNYSRYWHGYRIWLKPLLVFFYYTQIRLFNSYVFYIMLMLCCLYLYKEINWQAALSLLIIMIMLNITIIPMSLLFSCVFIISFIGAIVVLRFEKRDSDRVGLIFFSLGAITMFFDFYTYPFYSLGIPLFALLAYRAEKGKKLKQIIKTSVMFAIVWAIGYMGTFLAKLVLTAIAVSPKELETTAGIIKFRMNSTGDKVGVLAVIADYFIKGFYTVRSALRELFVAPHNYFFSLLIVLWAVLFPFFKKDTKVLKSYLGYFVIFIIPLIWLTLTASETRLHIYFQFRGIGLSVLVLIYFFMHSINFNKFRKFTSKILVIRKKHRKTDKLQS